MTILHVVLAFIVGGVTGYALRAQVGSELAKLHTKVDSVLAELRGKV